MKTFLVTGGAGFIGSHIVETLLERGERVRVLDNFLTGRRANLEPFLGRIELIEGDLRDEDACRKAAAGVDSVLHLAALPSVPRSVEDPRLTNDINITGTLNMLLAPGMPRSGVSFSPPRHLSTVIPRSFRRGKDGRGRRFLPTPSAKPSGRATAGFSIPSSV